MSSTSDCSRIMERGRTRNAAPTVNPQRGGGEPVQTFADVACTVCGCLCDDLEFAVEDERMVPLGGACHLPEPWIYALNDCRPPAASIEGEEATFDAAVEQAEQILRKSLNPLIFGLSRSSSRGQRAA